MSEYETTFDNFGKVILKHRLIWIQNYGEIPEGMIIHHKNGKKKDNRIKNLELCTIKEHGLKHRKPNRKRVYYPSGAIKIIKE